MPKDQFGVEPVGDMDKWTAPHASLLFACLRFSLHLLAHCHPQDDQFPSVALRLTRLSHYLVGLTMAHPLEVRSQQWFLLMLLHIHRALAHVRAVVHGPCDVYVSPTPQSRCIRLLMTSPLRHRLCGSPSRTHAPPNLSAPSSSLLTAPKASSLAPRFLRTAWLACGDL